MKLSPKLMITKTPWPLYGVILKNCFSDDMKIIDGFGWPQDRREQKLSHESFIMIALQKKKSFYIHGKIANIFSKNFLVVEFFERKNN